MEIVLWRIKKESLRKKFKPCLLSHVYISGKLLGEVNVTVHNVRLSSFRELQKLSETAPPNPDIGKVWGDWVSDAVQRLDKHFVWTVLLLQIATKTAFQVEFTALNFCYQYGAPKPLVLEQMVWHKYICCYIDYAMLLYYAPSLGPLGQDKLTHSEQIVNWQSESIWLKICSHHLTYTPWCIVPCQYFPPSCSPHSWTCLLQVSIQSFLAGCHTWRVHESLNSISPHNFRLFCLPFSSPVNSREPTHPKPKVEKPWLHPGIPNWSQILLLKPFPSFPSSHRDPSPTWATDPSSVMLWRRPTSKASSSIWNCFMALRFPSTFLW